MNKRRILAILIAFVMTIGATAMWSASTIHREGDPDAIVLEDSGSEAGEVQPVKKVSPPTTAAPVSTAIIFKSSRRSI